MVDDIADTYTRPPWLTEQGFVLGRPAPITMKSGIVLGKSLGFNDHAPEQAAVVLAFHQPAAQQIGGNQLCRLSEKAWGECWNPLVMGCWVAMGVA